MPTQPVAVIENDNEELVYESEEYTASLAYSYSPLPGPRSFRLLALLPGLPESKVQCQLSIHDLEELSDAKSYLAISYTWKASKFDRLCVSGRRIPITHPIHKRFAIRHPVCCGNRRLLVSTNLYNLLRRTRDSTHTFGLWIDALCINQEDLDERATQIPLMKDIYSRADNGILWLGEEDENTEKGVSLANSPAHHPTSDLSRRVMCSIPMSAVDLTRGSGLQRLGLPPIEDPAWKAYFTLFTRPVFKRAWVIQEVALAQWAPHTHCGSHWVSFPELMGSELFLRDFRWRDLIASKPGCFYNRTILNPYKLSVYRDATVAFMATDNNLAILSLAGTSSKSGAETPCWTSVPDTPHLLSLRTYLVDATKTTAVADPTVLQNSQLVEWLCMRGTLPHIYEATGEGSEDALWRTLAGNRNRYRQSQEFSADETEIREAFTDFIRAKVTLLMDGTQTVPESLERRFEPFVTTCVYNMLRRRFFLAQGGLMGMGPPSIRSGDMIYLIAGAQAPFVLRKSNTNSSLFSLVGDCYVHGIMHGECLSRDYFAWEDITLE